MTAVVFGVEFARPAALLVLLVLPALWWWGRRLPAVKERHSGALEIWRALAATLNPGDGRRGRRAPAHLVAALGGVLLAIVALAAPRRAEVAHAPVLVVEVDAGAALVADGDVETGRLARALRSVADIARSLQPRPGAIEWRAPGRPTRATAIGAAPPFEWFRDGADAGVFAPADAPDRLWLVARAPAGLPERAGLVAAGGAAAPGPVAWTKDRWIHGAGGVWNTSPRNEPLGVGFADDAARDAWTGPPLDVVRLWASDRGLQFDDADAEVLLRLAALPPPVRAGDVERDGWSATLVPRDRTEGGGERLGRDVTARSGRAPWLALADGSAVVMADGRGTLALAPGLWSEPRGDPAAFALSWARLLDGALREPDRVLPALARVPMGSPVAIAPQGFGGVAARAAGGAMLSWPQAALALAAAAAFALAARWHGAQ